MSNVKTVTATPAQIREHIAALQEELETLDQRLRHQDQCDPGTLAPQWADIRRRWKFLETVVGLAIRPQIIHMTAPRENEFGHEDMGGDMARKLTQEGNAFNRHKDRLSGLAANE